MTAAAGVAFGARTSTPRAADGWTAAFAGLVVRLAVVAWAAPRFPPAEDGHYYDVVATRISEGNGYTWLWPDGAVTYAAHYPVGYPALLGALYAVFGARPVLGMLLNALLGALAVVAVHRVAATDADRRGARLAAWAFALHPGLVFYTPAIMTEGAALSLLACAAWVTVRARRDARLRGLVVLGGLFGVVTLIRPQSLLLAPLYGFLATPPSAVRRAAVNAMAVTLVAIFVCSPWTVRNCVRMKSCVLVSANAGWNLHIGAGEGATGSWVPLDRVGVPDECRTVWDEAKKDACFGAAARREIVAHPLHFLALVPKKLAVTFDYAGAAGWYLHSSNPEAFPDSRKMALGAFETVWERMLVLLSLGALARLPGPRRSARATSGALCLPFLFVRAAWITHLGSVLVALLLGKNLRDHPPAALAAATICGTAVTHAVFFGGGRYSLVCFPAIAALAGTFFRPELERD